MSHRGAVVVLAVLSAALCFRLASATETKYVFKDKKNNTRAIVQGAFSFVISYQVKVNATDLDVPELAADNGTAAVKTETLKLNLDKFTSEAVLEPQEGAAQECSIRFGSGTDLKLGDFAMTFERKSESGQKTWNAARLTVKIDEALGFDKHALHYGKKMTLTFRVADTSEPVESAAKNIDLGKNPSERHNSAWRCSYPFVNPAEKCEVEGSPCDPKLAPSNMTVANSAIEAFKIDGETGSNFAQYRYLCWYDQQHSATGDGLYVVREPKSDVDCVQVTAEFSLKITYVTKEGGNKTTVLMVPSDAPVNPAVSSCNGTNGSQTLAINFLNNRWLLKLVFSQPKGKQFQVDEIEFKGRLVQPYIDWWFPNATVDQDISAENAQVGRSLAAQPGTHMKCMSNQDLKLDDGVTLHLQRVEMEAYMTEKKMGPPSLCALDARTSDLVPIIVGAALAVLVVIVLVAYLIGRWRAKRQGYASV